MKKRITPIPIAPPKLKTDTISSGNLPNADEVNQTVAQLTGKTIETPTPPATQNMSSETHHKTVEKKEKSKPNQPPTAKKTPKATAVVATNVAQPVVEVRNVLLKTFGRPPKPEAVGRDKFTTRLKTELVVELKTRAAKRKITVADLIEKIVGENFDRY